MEEKKVSENEMENKIGFKLGRLSQMAIKHDQRKADRQQKKAEKKAAWDALTEEEKHDFKKKRALKIGASIGGGVAIAGAAAIAAIKVMSGQKTDDLVEIDDIPEIEEIPETSDFTEYPVE